MSAESLVLDLIADKIDTARTTLAAIITCRGAGCAACCRSDVMAHPAEVRAILPLLTADAWSRIPVEPADTLVTMRKPCPLLDPATRTCTIYDHRPAICRSYAVVTPPEWCDAATSGPRDIARPAIPLEVAKTAIDNFLPGGIDNMTMLVTQLARVKRARGGSSPGVACAHCDDPATRARSAFTPYAALGSPADLVRRFGRLRSRSPWSIPNGFRLYHFTLELV